MCTPSGARLAKPLAAANAWSVTCSQHVTRTAPCAHRCVFGAAMRFSRSESSIRSTANTSTRAGSRLGILKTRQQTPRSNNSSTSSSGWRSLASTETSTPGSWLSIATRTAGCTSITSSQCSICVAAASTTRRRRAGRSKATTTFAMHGMPSKVGPVPTTAHTNASFSLADMPLSRPNSCALDSRSSQTRTRVRRSLSGSSARSQQATSAATGAVSPPPSSSSATCRARARTT